VINEGKPCRPKTRENYIQSKKNAQGRGSGTKTVREGSPRVPLRGERISVETLGKTRDLGEKGGQTVVGKKARSRSGTAAGISSRKVRRGPASEKREPKEEGLRSGKTLRKKKRGLCRGWSGEGRRGGEVEVVNLSESGETREKGHSGL